jgi:hypothetical protein
MILYIIVKNNYDKGSAFDGRGHTYDPPSAPMTPLVSCPASLSGTRLPPQPALWPEKLVWIYHMQTTTIVPSNKKIMSMRLISYCECRQSMYFYPVAMWLQV